MWETTNPNQRLSNPSFLTTDPCPLITVKNFPENLPLAHLNQGYSPFLLSLAINNY
jgi:hypothetical protein